MKKTMITLTAVVLFMCIASAQKATIGITAGGIVSNYKIKGDDPTSNSGITSNSKAGITAGIIANIPAGKNFVIQIGAHWVQKGSEWEENFHKISLTANSIEVAPNFLYNSGGFFIGAGPSVSFAVSGRWKVDDVSEKADFGNSDDDDMRGFDFGANFLTGYQFPSGFLVTANFNQGFSNLVPGEPGDAKLKSHYFGIRLGYVLKGKK